MGLGPDKVVNWQEIELPLSGKFLGLRRPLVGLELQSEISAHPSLSI